MTSIPAICNKFKSLYLKKERLFDHFCSHFSWNLEHSHKKEEYPSLIITEIIASERDFT